MRLASYFTREFFPFSPLLSCFFQREEIRKEEILSNVNMYIPFFFIDLRKTWFEKIILFLMSLTFSINWIFVYLKFECTKIYRTQIIWYFFNHVHKYWVINYLKNRVYFLYNHSNHYTSFTMTFLYISRYLFPYILVDYHLYNFRKFTKHPPYETVPLVIQATSFDSSRITKWLIINPFK